MKLHPRYRRGEVDCENLHGHAVLLGYGRAGRQTLQAFKEHGIPTIVIDDDAAVIRALIENGIHCIQGEGQTSACWLARIAAKLKLSFAPCAAHATQRPP